jgi:hypothetical protein
MTRLNDIVLKAELKKVRVAQGEIVDSAVPGLAVRVGRGPAATWSLVLRVRGEGGVSRRGFEKKGRRYRLSLGTYPAMSLEAARARANEFIARLLRPERTVPWGGRILQWPSGEFGLIVRVGLSPRSQFTSSIDSILSVGTDRNRSGSARSRLRVASRLRAASRNSSRRSAHPCIIRRRSGRCSA